MEIIRTSYDMTGTPSPIVENEVKEDYRNPKTGKVNTLTYYYDCLDAWHVVALKMDNMGEYVVAGKFEGLSIVHRSDLIKNARKAWKSYRCLIRERGYTERV